MPATGANTTPIVRVSAGLSSRNQKPLADLIQEGYWEVAVRLIEAMRGGATDKYVRKLQGQVQIWQNLIQGGQNLSQPGQGQRLPRGYPIPT